MSIFIALVPLETAAVGLNNEPKNTNAVANGLMSLPKTNSEGL
ncbi:hypothetical protein QG083_10455 [Kingella kingae]|nr:hypothetical protein [Kingella kingae]MDK4613589.1 hypothetical protein [Kingella kingae]